MRETPLLKNEEPPALKILADSSEGGEYQLNITIKMNTVQRYAGRGNIAQSSSRAVKKRPQAAVKAYSRSTISPRPSAFEEVWQPFPNFEDRYEISSFGRICSVHTGRIIPTEIDQNGFEIIWIKKAPNRKSLLLHVHWVVATAFLGVPDQGSISKHIDGNPLNNRAHNLHWVANAVVPAESNESTLNLSDHE